MACLFLYTNQPLLCAVMKACQSPHSCCAKKCECAKKASQSKGCGCSDTRELASQDAPDGSQLTTPPVLCALACEPSALRAPLPHASWLFPSPEADGSVCSQAELSVFRI